MSDTTDNLFGESNLAPPARRKRAAAAMVGMPRTVRILLEESDNIPPTGLPLGANGIGYLLRPGVEVDVPEVVLDILEHAIISTPIMDPSTQQVMGHRDQRRYPFRVITRRAADESG